MRPNKAPAAAASCTVTATTAPGPSACGANGQRAPGSVPDQWARAPVWSTLALAVGIQGMKPHRDVKSGVISLSLSETAGQQLLSFHLKHLHSRPSHRHREAREAENKKGGLGTDMYAPFKAASCRGWERQGAQSLPGPMAVGKRASEGGNPVFSSLCPRG